MPTDPAAVLDRLTERLAPLDRALNQAWWAAVVQAQAVGMLGARAVPLAMEG